mmetsp:Transcript_50265/g.93632  ORF Transcript_50265/g.93632 Transcript_50265/m.93632 type:complete len:253 (+) Transcript_50265:2147-2905(+)
MKSSSQVSGLVLGGSVPPTRKGSSSLLRVRFNTSVMNPSTRNDCDSMLAFHSLMAKQMFMSSPRLRAIWRDSGRSSMTRSGRLGWFLSMLEAHRMFCSSSASGVAVKMLASTNTISADSVCARARSVLDKGVPRRNLQCFLHHASASRLLVFSVSLLCPSTTTSGAAAPRDGLSSSLRKACSTTEALAATAPPVTTTWPRSRRRARNSPRPLSSRSLSAYTLPDCTVKKTTPAAMATAVNMRDNKVVGEKSP